MFFAINKNQSLYQKIKQIKNSLIQIFVLKISNYEIFNNDWLKNIIHLYYVKYLIEYYINENKNEKINSDFMDLH